MHCDCSQSAHCQRCGAQNGYPDESFDGLPQFNPTSGQPPLYGPSPSVPGCNPADYFDRVSDLSSNDRTENSQPLRLGLAH